MPQTPEDAWEAATKRAEGQSRLNDGLGGDINNRLGSKEIDRIAKKVLESADELAPNANFKIKGWDRATALCVIQALIAVLEDEGLLVPPNA